MHNHPHTYLKAIAAAAAVLSAPALMSHPAEAGGAQAKTLTPPKFASMFHVRKHRTAKSSTPITEYSSSSATGSKSKPNR